MVKIPLTQNKVAITDKENAQLQDIKWYAHRNNSSFYAARKWKTPEGNQGKQMLHHLVLGVTRLPRKFGLCADHINGNTLDNRRSNLRIVSTRENGQNTYRHRKGNLVGVRFCKKSNSINPWLSRIRIGKDIKYLGYFRTREEASNAYWKACWALGE